MSVKYPHIKVNLSESDGKGHYQKRQAIKFLLGSIVIALSNIYLDLIRKELLWKKRK